MQVGQVGFCLVVVKPALLLVGIVEIIIKVIMGRGEKVMYIYIYICLLLKKAQEIFMYQPQLQRIHTQNQITLL